MIQIKSNMCHSLYIFSMSFNYNLSYRENTSFPYSIMSSLIAPVSHPFIRKLTFGNFSLTAEINKLKEK